MADPFDLGKPPEYSTHTTRRGYSDPARRHLERAYTTHQTITPPPVAPAQTPPPSTYQPPTSFRSVQALLDPAAGDGATPALTTYLETLHEVLANILNGGLVLGPVDYLLTIAAGAITLPDVEPTARRILNVVLDTEGAASLDQLDTINGGSERDEIRLWITDAARQVELTSAGNLKLGPAGAFFLQQPTDCAVLQLNGGSYCALSLRNNG